MLVLLLLIGVVWYLISAIRNPEKHVVGLVILTILYAIFASFFDTTGAKSDYDRKKKG